MSQRKALVYFCTFLVLLVWYRWETREPADAPIASTPSVARLIDLAVPDITEVVLRSGDVEITCIREGERWRVPGPQVASIPSDLVPGILDGLVITAPVEVVGPLNGREAEFGFAQPRGEIVLRRSGQPDVTVQLGSHNPSNTAVYARRLGNDTVVLIGLQVDYYFGLGIGGA